MSMLMLMHMHNRARMCMYPARKQRAATNACHGPNKFAIESNDLTTLRSNRQPNTLSHTIAALMSPWHSSCREGVSLAGGAC